MCVTGPRCCAEGRMAPKKMGQASFVEAFLRPDVGANRRLERIDRMIDWAPLERLVKPVRSGAWGRPSYPPLSMLEALFLQRWYCLSDEGLEEALADGCRSGGSAGSPSTTRRPTARPSAAFGWPWSPPSCRSAYSRRW